MNTSSEYNWIINIKNEDTYHTNMTIYGRIYLVLSILIELTEEIIKKLYK